MSRRGQNAIRGPQSALTDYLAANNISAAQIRADYLQRQRDAANATGEGASGPAAGHDQDEREDSESGDQRETEAQRQRRKKREAASVSKIKASKEFVRKKRRLAGEPGEDDDDEIAWDMYTKQKPLPGQLENCELCGKRFTVTAYSKEGPAGGLLCTKCSKETGADKKKEVTKRKATVAREKRRQVQSDLLHGIVRTGSKTLQELCIETVAKNIYDVDDFGDLPPNLLDRLSQILSKNRILTPRVLPLFLRSDHNTVAIYDCGRLETEDFISIFQFTPKVERIHLRCAGQIKDNVVDFIIERDVPIRSLQLEASNLVSDEKWQEYFAKCGHRLEELRLSWLDFAMSDDTVRHLVRGCPNLRRLKLEKCFQIGDGALAALAELKHIERLGLNMAQPTTPEVLDSLIEAVGEKLRRLSLEGFPDANDDFLANVHDHCRRLEKLRFTCNDVCSDKGFTSLFENWENPPLCFIDLSSNRDVDYSKPDGPEEATGLATSSLQALMRHSGSQLETLNISSCRHVTSEALGAVFDGEKQYPKLREIDLSFLTTIDTPTIAGIFQSCPSIMKITVFGCFELKDVLVPPKVALIGLPNAQEQVVLESNEQFMVTV